MLVADDLHIDPDEDGPQSSISGQDRRWLMLSGAAALVVIVLLVLAVLHTARSSTTPSGVPGTTSAPSSTSSPATVSRVPSSTSYSPPSVQTSEAGTTVEPIAPIETAPVAPTQEAPTSTPSPPTTIFNPYATTSVPNAGAF